MGRGWAERWERGAMGLEGGQEEQRAASLVLEEVQ